MLQVSEARRMAAMGKSTSTVVKSLHEEKTMQQVSADTQIKVAEL